MRTQLAANSGAGIFFALILASCGGGYGGKSAPPASTVTLRVAPGALQAATAVTVTETEAHHGALRRVELEPRGLALSTPSRISIKVSGDSSTMKLVEIEDAAGGEVEHALETERHNGTDNARQAEIEHLGTFEVRGAASCEVACDAGSECDDGVCKPSSEVEAADDPATHDVGDDHGTDPVPPPPTGTGPTACPAGLELDPSDGVCKDHGGGTDPAPAPSPTPTPTPDPTACPAGMELDPSDGTCKLHGGSGGGKSGP